MPASTIVEVAAAAVHLFEYVLVEAVEAHGEALQARGLELGRVLGEPRAVGREREVLDARRGRRARRRSRRCRAAAAARRP